MDGSHILDEMEHSVLNDNGHGMFNRRSIRRFEDRDVGTEDVSMVIRAGLSAPSAHDGRPWHMVVINDKNVSKAISEIRPKSSMVASAPVSIVVCCDNHMLKGMSMEQDCAAAVQNMLIMINELGLGGVWVGLMPDMDLVGAIGELLGLPDHVQAFAIVAFGHPGEVKGPRPPPSGRIHLNHW